MPWNQKASDPLELGLPAFASCPLRFLDPGAGTVDIHQHDRLFCFWNM
ncbi:hypothetical protein LEMLEM_LOCUS23734, partial [Lemmus lemmus]